ncbi:helix-turn-helix transcriptional regulator [Paenibacillus puerhi]|uniref:helix-turn-helix transcriptional regulator n=1 Tax=Paenibacillus puerhi TaxID=2692622 RepID=UPI0013587995|nr:helix-turn-helix domain-containing protein [Paenibacillus puerhi]
MKLPVLTYRWKMFWFILLSATLPVMLLGLFSYVQTSTSLEQKVLLSNNQNVLQTQLRVEQLLKTIDNSMVQLIQQAKFEDILEMEISRSPYHFDELNDIRSSLNSLQAYELGIYDVYLVSLKESWYSGNNDFQRLSQEVQQAMLSELGPFTYGTRWVYTPTPTLFGTPPPTRSMPTINLVKTIPFNTTKPEGLLIVQVTNDDLAKLIAQTEGLGNFTIADENFRLLASPAENTPPMQALPPAITNHLQNQNAGEGYFQIALQKEAYGVSYRKSSYNHWIYINTVSIGDIKQDSSAIGLVTLLITGLLVALISFISLRGSQRMYRPIRGIYQALTSQFDTTAKDRESDDIEDIQNRIYALAIQHSAMSDQIKGQSNQIMQFFLTKLLRGEVSAHEVQEKLEWFHQLGTWKQMCVLTTQVDAFEDTRFDERDKDLLLFAVNNIIEEIVSREQCLQPVLIHESQVTVLGIDSIDEEKCVSQAMELAKHIQSTVQMYLQLKISIGISLPFQDLRYASLAFQEGLEALKHRIRLGQELILYIGDVEPKQSMKHHYPKFIEKELIDAIRFGNREQSRELLHRFFHEVNQKNMGIKEYQLYLNRLLLEMLSLAENTDHTIKGILDDNGNLMEHISRIQSEQEMKTWFEFHIMEPIVSDLEKESKDRYKKLSETVIQLIQQEFDTEMTLESCAARLNYNPDYIRRVFRQETGMNFSEYLYQYRLDTAKKWLIETDMKIADIAAALKYNNSQNFIRYFRKFEGMTPGQYREQFKLDG